jgi:hypothetical protein
VQYKRGVLLIDDLNPEHQIHWQMSRWEMLKLGWRCMLTAIVSRT